ncbi:MAG: hypothetical protein NXI10_00245 [bacterium]|nr:hypothetical protein [bacterium]
MKSIAGILTILAIILSSSSARSQYFCDNLKILHKQIAFEESFTESRGEEISNFTKGAGQAQMKVTEYAATQDLIPGNPGKIIYQDHSGIMDFWIYQVTSSIVSDKDAQLENAEYWFNSVKTCLGADSTWTYEITERTYDSEEKIKIWKASKPLDSHFGFVHKTVSVFVFEERDENLRKTGRYGVRIELM